MGTREQSTDPLNRCTYCGKKAYAWKLTKFGVMFGVCRHHKKIYNRSRAYYTRAHAEIAAVKEKMFSED